MTGQHMMNEIYHFVIWGFKRLNIYYSLYFVGIFCITVGILNYSKGGGGVAKRKRR